jgi:hypothetical protein
MSALACNEGAVPSAVVADNPPSSRPSDARSRDPYAAADVVISGRRRDQLNNNRRGVWVPAQGRDDSGGLGADPD